MGVKVPKGVSISDALELELLVKEGRQEGRGKKFTCI